MASHPILIVDDSLDLLEAYRAVLDTHGYEVREAQSARDALSILKEWQPELLMTDISMPEMDGFELIAEVRARLKDHAPPVLVCSAFGITEGEAMRRGARRFLPKPVQAATLLAVIEELLGGPEAGEEQLRQAQQRTAEQRALSNARAQRHVRDLPRERVSGHASPWLEWLRSYFDCSWTALYFLRGDALELVGAAGETAVDALDRQELRAIVAEVIETGTSLAIGDARSEPWCHAQPAGGPVRLFTSVPLIAADGVAVGALCVADRRAHPCEAESLVILEDVGRRGASILAHDSSEDVAAARARAPLLRQATFEVVVAMELRIASRRAESVELAIIEVAHEEACVDCAQRLWRLRGGRVLPSGRWARGGSACAIEGWPAK